MTGRVPTHECRWFIISRFEDGEPALYACGAIGRCIKTMTSAEFTRKKTLPPTMERPYE